MRPYLFPACVAMALLVGAAAPAPFEGHADPAPASAFDGSVTVLTYNVKGLPWPVAFGRTRDLRRIGDRLRSMHAEGTAPHVVVLQEAFTKEAQAIGRIAGYRYIAQGPGKDDARSAKMSPEDVSYIAAARWWKGEKQGKLLGSGLQIMSNYPIVAVERMTFADNACAGYDCLANKGALLVRIRIPGAPTAIDVMTTHLNSRGASGVNDARSIYGYGRQVEALAAFVRRAHDPHFPLIAAGDYNVGSAQARRDALLGTIRHGWGTGFEVRDAYGQFQRQGGTLSDDAANSFRRAKDWQFYSAGSQGKLNVVGIDVPFGRDSTGAMLSDHIGYVARYSLSPADGNRGRAALMADAT